jgi:uncharacterized membrane protein YtjA (UPF0391 family)
MIFGLSLRATPEINGLRNGRDIAGECSYKETRVRGKPTVYLMLAVMAGLAGFGGYLFGIPSLLDVSAFLPESLNGVVAEVSRLLTMLLLLFFILSVCFGKRLRDRH